MISAYLRALGGFHTPCVRHFPDSDALYAWLETVSPDLEVVFDTAGNLVGQVHTLYTPGGKKTASLCIVRGARPGAQAS